MEAQILLLGDLFSFLRSWISHLFRATVGKLTWLCFRAHKLLTTNHLFLWSYSQVGGKRILQKISLKLNSFCKRWSMPIVNDTECINITVKSWNYSIAPRGNILRAQTYRLEKVGGFVDNLPATSSPLPPPHTKKSNNKRKKEPDSEIVSSFFHLKKPWQGLFLSLRSRTRSTLLLVRSVISLNFKLCVDWCGLSCFHGNQPW